MALKIATGQFKGITLVSTDTARELRPTQAIVREAIINTLGSMGIDFEELDILDLYSGTGSMGFEFLSNGANSITFVERDPKCQALLRTNTAKLKLKDRVSLLSGTLPGVLKALKRKNSTAVKEFDLVFFDPPFKFTVDQFTETVKAVLEYQLIKTEGLMLLEYKNMELVKELEHSFSEDLVILKTKKYGDCTVVFAQKTIPKLSS